MTPKPKLTATLVRRLETALDRALAGDLDAARAIYEGVRPKSARPPRRTKGAHNLALSPDADALLDATGNASRYVEQVVEQRWRAWQHALGVLRDAGWRGREVRAACGILLGPPMEGTAPRWIAAELHDGERLNGTATQCGVDPAVWAARVRQVHESDEVARALAAVIEEFWAYNDALERAIARLDEV